MSSGALRSRGPSPSFSGLHGLPRDHRLRSIGAVSVGVLGAVIAGYLASHGFVALAAAALLGLVAVPWLLRPGAAFFLALGIVFLVPYWYTVGLAQLDI